MSSKKFKKWEIWYANVKFEEGTGCKKRPVLIYNETDYIVISFKMTSTNRGDNRDEYQVKEWLKAGLEKPTSVRLQKVLRLEESDFVNKIGRLTAADVMQIEQRLAAR